MSKPLAGVVSIDDGGSSTCVVTRSVQESFSSVKGLLGNENLISPVGKHDFIVDWKGSRYVAGELARLDCKYPLQMHSHSKQHDFFDLSVLISCFVYGYDVNYIIISSPIDSHTEEEKRGRIERLKKTHTLTINGKTKMFSINEVKVAPETASAFWVNEFPKKTRYLDLGSRTIGFGTVLNENDVVRYISSESGTFYNKGLDDEFGYNPKGLADYICGRLLKLWKESDRIYLIGGGAYDGELCGYIKEYFPNTQVLNNPKMANALGMYQIGTIAYDMA